MKNITISLQFKIPNVLILLKQNVGESGTNTRKLCTKLTNEYLTTRIYIHTILIQQKSVESHTYFPPLFDDQDLQRTILYMLRSWRIRLNANICIRGSYKVIQSYRKRHSRLRRNKHSWTRLVVRRRTLQDRPR